MLLAGAILLAMGAFLYREHFKIKQLNKKLSLQHQEISLKQAEIIKQKDEIEAQNERLEFSQKKIIDAQTTIQEQNIKLQSYNRNLEKQVEERTNALQKAFDELLTINNDLDTLTYRASHDLKSPVATLDGLCTVALMEIEEEKPGFYFHKIKEIAKNMANLLDNLSRLRDIKHTIVKKEEVQLSALITNIFHAHSEGFPEIKNINFKNETPDNLFISTDAEILKLVLEQLLQNSIIFSLPLASLHTPFIEVKTNENDLYAEIIITDNSEEISNEISRKIFNMFFRGSERSKGVGLGLYTAKNAVEKLGGSIKYVKGSNAENIFIVVLPKNEIDKEPTPIKESIVLKKKSF